MDLRTRGVDLRMKGVDLRMRGVATPTADADLQDLYD